LGKKFPQKRRRRKFCPQGKPFFSGGALFRSITIKKKATWSSRGKGESRTFYCFLKRGTVRDGPKKGTAPEKEGGGRQISSWLISGWGAGCH